MQTYKEIKYVGRAPQRLINANITPLQKTWNGRKNYQISAIKEEVNINEKNIIDKSRTKNAKYMVDKGKKNEGKATHCRGKVERG